MAQPSAPGDSFVGFGEQRDIIARAVFLGFAGFDEGLIEDGVLAVVGQGAQHVFDRDFEHHVHPAAQVETEVDLFFLALFVVELDETEVVDRLGLDRIQIVLFLDGIAGRVLGRLLFDTLRDECKRKLVGTSDRERDGQQLQCTFVLHVDLG